MKLLSDLRHHYTEFEALNPQERENEIAKLDEEKKSFTIVSYEGYDNLLMPPARRAFCNYIEARLCAIRAFIKQDAKIKKTNRCKTRWNEAQKMKRLAKKAAKQQSSSNGKIKNLLKHT